ncbi:MAG TPA: hypothetical protein VFJ87_00995 [Rhodanobacteraceae bacterium]|nr:hypothetical protein [Rhodanobacteraceae bacterium]
MTESAAWPALWAASFIASIALALASGAEALAAGAAAVEASAGAPLVAALAAEVAEAAAELASWAALLAADDTAAAAFWAWSAADWPSLPLLLQADSDKTIAEATAAASKVRVNFMEISWNLAVETTFVAGALNIVRPHNASVSPFYERITFRVRLPRWLYKPATTEVAEDMVRSLCDLATPLRVSTQIISLQTIPIAVWMRRVLAIRERAGQ